METKNCLNCDTKMEGPFCPKCGQKNKNPNITVKQLLNQFMDEFFTFDNRFYKTLKPLMLSPGKVTMDYNIGKRARYMPLLKLYLFVSFALFLLIPYSSAMKITNSSGSKAAGTPLEKSAAKVRTNVEPTVLEFEKKKPQEKTKSKIKDFSKWIGNKISNMDPQALRKEIIGRFPQMMFLLMPFLAALLKLFYRGNDNLYTHHLVFSLHFHTFTFILFIVMILCEISGISLLKAAAAFLIFFVPWYLYRGMKNISGQSRLRTLFKTGTILFIYWIVTMICMLALILISLALS